MELSLHLHASKEQAYEAGGKAGLAGDALRMFSHAGNEHTVRYRVDAETGVATPIRFDEFLLVPLLDAPCPPPDRLAGALLAACRAAADLLRRCDGERRPTEEPPATDTDWDKVVVMLNDVIAACEKPPVEGTPIREALESMRPFRAEV